MAKTNPIGVRFDETLLGKLKEMGYPTPQRALSFLELFWAKNVGKIVEINNQPENKERIEEERNPTPPLSFMELMTFAKAGNPRRSVEYEVSRNLKLSPAQISAIHSKITTL